ncbi:MAG: type I-E CRISPR-associated protein Cas7/Cse4/CasC [Cutibacterium avidum]|uniref:type I-E CRISPR-associated protein Cas7/Cse4/CasC n=1 Tax=Cutibacterium avidum TaxID=33010 RepID=UPI00081008C9|nr:type I-E CRISPR-associated protein Cas7/Cse4/CasC [Cutibacterium avidum]MBS5745841.1 type I-E CRISPR-associated protein Cas7/Cse4/CasC [Propionibacterium sp.]MDU3726835.1 type I-E CRISPR-associated protein Cas7/Cse4/CasC [Cutibacterium avidum]MDU4207452.1 type I-E CRISPR-associated protein Cas7/Cse4/CasC [Cutibacterium avidum]MDU4635864.1 type I-E CRISPR-associated protein Cas7/Cse4/CasC [Cutibacterium avidum]MDU4677102.1 type I-E CRISPR-associated protein Cas7/Cse4/CasC [Cutibacterium avid
MSSYYVDIHVLQSVPPSNVNRDDTGAPKSALYGGVRRARISSQAWKKAVRTSFKDFLPASQTGARTLRVVELLMNRLTADPYRLAQEDARQKALAVVKALGLKADKPRVKDGSGHEGVERTQYLVFYSNQQLDRLAQLAATSEGKISSSDAKKAADSDHGIEVALFGRMVADSKDLNVDSAVQVAHALSTHAVEIESDYFTAVDDYKLDEDDAGAGMIGTVEFTSETLYRFATVAVSTLEDNLGDVDLTADAAAAFVRGFVVSMPTGKQNTFANNTLPDAVVVQIRKGRSASFVGAFEDAITSTTGGFVEASCKALASYAHDCEEAFLGAPVASFVTRVGTRTEAVSDMGTAMPIDELVSSVRDQVATVLRAQS